MEMRMRLGGDIVSLEIGEPDFNAPPHVQDAVERQAREGARYTSSMGRADLREAAAEKLRRVDRVRVAPEGVLFTQGSVQGVSLVIQGLLSAGDELLLPDPAWPNYALIARQAGAVVRSYPLLASNQYLPDVEQIRRLVTRRTRLLVVNSPGNPTGAVLDASVIQGLVSIAREQELLLLSDEAYDELVFDATHVSPRTLDADHVIAAYSLSKTYAMTGYRIGYLVPPERLHGKLLALHEASLGCISALSQAAGLAALTGPQQAVEEMRLTYERRRDLVVELLRQAGIRAVRPRGAFYCMVSLHDDADSRASAIALLRSGVAVAPGSAFGSAARSEVRLSLAASEEALRTGVERLVDWYAASDGGREIPTAVQQR